MFFRCKVLSHLNKSSEMPAQNSLPWSMMRSMGIPKQQIQWLKMAEETVAASHVWQGHELDIFGEGVSDTQDNFFPFVKLSRGLNRSAQTLWFGLVGWGRLEMRSSMNGVWFLHIWQW